MSDPHHAHQLLREATAALHRELESTPAARTLMSGSPDLGGYRHFLLCNLRLREALKARMGDVFDVEIRLLHEDLAVLGPVEGPPAHPLRLGEDPATLTGARYVLEGSRLGAGHLVRNLEAHGEGRFPLAYLRGYASGAGLAWNAYRQELAEALRTPADVERAVAGARASFRWLCDEISAFNAGEPTVA